MVGITPSRNAPDSGSAARCAVSTRSCAWATSVRAFATTSSPARVSRTCRLSRSTSSVPSTLSSSLMPAESVDWVTNEASAAARKLSRSATATR